MTAGYGAILAITCLTLFSLTMLVRANGRIAPHAKKRFYMICGVILLSAFWEWLSIFLNGAPLWTRWLHVLAKGMDYIFTPICSVFFVRQVVDEPRRSRPMYALLGGNAALQLLSAFTGWTYYVDEANIYGHGPLHWIYTVVSVIAVLFVMLAFLDYGKKFERQNRGPLAAIFLLLITTVALQEVLGNEARVSYLGMSVASCLVYIHYTEFGQAEQDAAMRRQDELLATDALTGVLSRFAYKQVAADYNMAERLPDWLVAFEVDLNGLKTVNDLIGHEAGDELLRGTGTVLKQTIGEHGKVFRIGGDEFVILLDSRTMQPQQAVHQLREASAAWHGTEAKEMSLSIGYAAAEEFPEYRIEQLVHEADQRMYQDKDHYYSLPGHDRRRGPRGSVQS